jgi:hypothetical protein
LKIRWKISVVAQFKVALRNFAGGTEENYEKPVMAADHLVETGIRAPKYAVMLLIPGCDIWFKINNLSQFL